MAHESNAPSFPLAKMSASILTLTLVLFGLPVGFLIGAQLGEQALFVPAVALIVIYAWVWLRLRPSRFTVQRGGLEVIWPLRRRKIAGEEISSVRIVDRRALKKEIGWGIRIGAGGLWGGFGWLWTKRRGLVQMYISRTDRFVWIECARGRPWLITPENSAAFVSALSDR
jgi:hypothetical protein